MELITCLNCSTQNPSKAKFCKSCGKRLKCESCGESLEKDARNCINCGEPIENKVNSSNRNTIDYSNNNGNVNLKIDVTDRTAQSSITEIFKNIGLSGNNTRQIGPKDNEVNYSKPETHDVHHEEITPPQDNSKATSGVNTEEYPHLNDVEMNIKCSEANWIAIYAFYISNYGNEYFSQAQVKEKYLTERKGDSNSSNFSKNWKSLFSKYFRTKSDDNYYFIKESIPELVNIITGKTKTTSRPQPKRVITNADITTKKSSTPKSKSTSTTPEEFNTDGNNNKSSLKDFLNGNGVEEKSRRRVLAIAFYIIELNKSDCFTAGNIDYAYKALNLNNRIDDIEQLLRNVKNRYVWFTQVENGWKLTTAGYNFFRDNYLVKNK